MSPQDEYNLEQYEDENRIPIYSRDEHNCDIGINLGHVIRHTDDLREIDREIFDIDYEIAILTRVRKLLHGRNGSSLA